MVANLLDNAVKFTRRGRVKLVLKREFLRVEDSGSGVEEEVRERLFERFVKGKGSSGEGIGLSVVKEIAELHGWRVAYESSKGGSAFTVWFKGVAEDFCKEA
jgi:two-component system phosphate regulon sensor histidine kinase PhoR